MNIATTSNNNAVIEIIIFGGAGDLSTRKLLPALYMAHLHDELSDGTRIIGVGRQDWTRQDYLDLVNSHSPSFVEPSEFDDGAWQKFLKRLDCEQQTLTLEVADEVLAQRSAAAPDLSAYQRGSGRDLFALFRQHAAGAEDGGSPLLALFEPH